MRERVCPRVGVNMVAAYDLGISGALYKLRQVVVGPFGPEDS